MLKAHQVARIIRLSDDGLSVRSISAITGIARVTVGQIIRRRRRQRLRQLGLEEGEDELEPEPAPAPPPEFEETVEAAPPNELAEDGLYYVKKPVFTRQPERCPKCGGVCYMPCLACRVRRWQRRRKAKQAENGGAS